jgi:GNAT superfamily N-acetyltransferase
MGRGLGRRLFQAAVLHARSLGARELEITSDPNAEAFYLRHGARRVGEVASQPAGRLLPLLVLAL